MMANEMEMRDLPSMTRLVVAVVQAKLPGEKVEGKAPVASLYNPSLRHTTEFFLRILRNYITLWEICSADAGQPTRDEAKTDNGPSSKNVDDLCRE